MESKMRRCKQCGEIKNLSDFRPYYNRKGGHYRTCKVCERINNRYKYLTRKDEAERSDTHQAEIDKIEALYDILRDRGLKPPESATSTVIDDIEALLGKQAQLIEEANELDAPVDAPEDLKKWLTEDLSNYTLEDLEELEETLLGTYKKQIGVDPKTYAPIFDDTHRATLNKVLERLDDYADALE